MIVDSVVAILKKMTIFRGKAGGETFMNKYVNYLRPVFIMRLLYCCFDTSGRIWPSV